MHIRRLVLSTLGVLMLIPSISSVCPAQLGLKLVNGGNVDPYVDVQHDKTLVPRTGITVEAWVTYDASTLGSGWRWPTIARQDSTAGKTSYFLRVEASTTKARRLSWAVDTSRGLVFAIYPFASGELRKWTHVAGTFDGQAARLYVNGVLKATNTNVGPHLTDRGKTFRIGNGDLTIPGGETWNGEIDEVRLWPFARTADEIRSTMNLALVSVPGLVSTWNLNFSPKDSSGNNDGVNVNKPTYAQNSLKLLAAPIGGTGFGAGTAGCPEVPAAGVSALARVGSNAFAITCVHSAVRNQGSGLLWVGAGRLSSPVSVGGAAMWVDPGKGGVLLPVQGDANGLTRLLVPIPASTPVGISVHCQFFFSQSGCRVPIFASGGLTIQTQK